MSVCFSAPVSTSCPVCGQLYRRDSRSGGGHGSRSYSLTWLDGVGSAGSLLPTNGHVAVRNWGGGESRWLKLWWTQTHHELSQTLINSFTHAVTDADAHTQNAEVPFVYILFLICTYSGRAVTRSGHCSALSVPTSPSVSSDMTYIYTPSCVWESATAVILWSNRKTLQQLSPFNCFLLFGGRVRRAAEWCCEVSFSWICKLDFSQQLNHLLKTSPGATEIWLIACTCSQAFVTCSSLTQQWLFGGRDSFRFTFRFPYSQFGRSGSSWLKYLRFIYLFIFILLTFCFLPH